MEGFSLAIPSLRNLDAEWKKLQHEARVELDRIIDLERSDGMSIKVLVREGHPDKEILDVVKEMKIDLIIMIAHEKRRLERLLFGRSGEELIRKMPCSVLLVKQEAGPIAYSSITPAAYFLRWPKRHSFSLVAFRRGRDVPPACGSGVFLVDSCFLFSYTYRNKKRAFLDVFC
jgi:hypothetical protein